MTIDDWDNCALTNTHIWDPDANKRVMYCARCDSRAPLKVSELDWVEERHRALWAIPTTVAEIRNIVQGLDPDLQFGKDIVAMMAKVLREDEGTTIAAIGEASQTIDPEFVNLEFGQNVIRGVQRLWEAENEKLFDAC